MPAVMYTFFDEYDFRGKIIIPFTTHGGSRLSVTGLSGFRWGDL